MPSRPGNHLQQLAICAPEWVNAANKIPAAVKGSGRTHAQNNFNYFTHVLGYFLNTQSSLKRGLSVQLLQRSLKQRELTSPLATSLLNLCQRKVKRNTREEVTNQKMRWKLPVDHCFSEHRLSLANNRQRTRRKKTQTLMSWLKNYSYSSKFNWPKRVSVDQVI